MIYYSHKYKPVDSARTKYLLDREKSLVDFTNRIPDKTIEKVNLPWGFYGYTYLGHNRAWLNERLDETPEKKTNTDMHEVSHTDWEYETRVRTDWKLNINENEIRKRISENYN